MFLGGVNLNQREKSFATKNKILNAASMLFLEKGYEETTMQDIMESSGVSKGAIYHYFVSKQEIISFMIKDAQKHINTRFLEIADDNSLSAEEKIKAVITYFMENREQNILIANKWIDKVPYALVDTIRNANKYIAPQIAKIIKQGTQNGNFQCNYPDELAEVLIQLFDVWLDPVITERTLAETVNRLKFIFHLLDCIGVPLFSKENITVILSLFEKARTDI